MNPISLILVLLFVLIRDNESTNYCDYHENEEVPEVFNSWQAWPHCAQIIGDVKDQSKCGACWSVAIAGALSDRICIASNGTQQVKISAWDMQSCYPGLRNQCSVGYNVEMEDVFKLWISNGFTSGGNYGELNTCRPYPFAPYDQCEDCVDKTRTYRCHRKCVNGANYRKDKHFGRSYCKVRNDERAIRSEIMRSGSVIAVFIVFDDFPRRANNYDFTQIYVSNLKDFKAKHVVKIIGWGIELGVKYWILQNSWGTSYGLNGHFKMVRGMNNCDIEGNVYAGYV